MTITAVNPFTNEDGGIGVDGHQTYTNKYHVYGDSTDGADSARGIQAIALGLPAYGDSWAWELDANQYAKAVSRVASRVYEPPEGTNKKWLVTITYSTKGRSLSASQPVGNPIAVPWKISGSFVQTTETASRDKDEKLITNKAEEPRLVEVPSGHDTLILDGNTSSISLSTRSASARKVNSNPMWGLASRQLYLSQWTYDILTQGVTQYVSNHLEFWIADPDDLWNFQLAETGTRYIDPVNKLKEFPEFRYTPFTAADIDIGHCWLKDDGDKLDVLANPNGNHTDWEILKEYNFLTNLSFLPNPLPGPFV